MIKAISSIDGPPLTINAAVSGLAIYLDNFSLISLAKGDPSRRKRLVAALHTGSVDLMFSVTNAAELTGPLGQSFDAIKAFLDEVGPHWLPKRCCSASGGTQAPGEYCAEVPIWSGGQAMNLHFRPQGPAS
jgi:hypothetical protein